MISTEAGNMHDNHDVPNIGGADLAEIKTLIASLVCTLKPFIEGNIEDRRRLKSTCATSLFGIYNLLHYLMLPEEKCELLLPWLIDLTTATEANFRDPTCDLM